jgi:DMSO/TMAO reductase YedYZ molybdopterin-dependent catalytic subunit
MRKRWASLFFVLIICFLAACQPAQNSIVQQTAAQDTNAVILEVVGVNATKTFTLADLQQMTPLEGYAGLKSSTGQIFPPELYKGVSLLDLIDQVGGWDSTLGVVIEAKDGYSITYSYDQIVNGNFITYDVSTGDEINVAGPKKVIVAYDKNGQTLDPNGEGPLRLFVIGDNKPIVDGHWSIKWVTRITIKPIEENWSLHLEGAISDDVDRATFESGASPDCHLTSWTDADGNEWSGIPLYYLVGRMDDEIKHDGPAYNDELAKVNSYTVEVVASDGFSVTFDAFRVMRNDNMIVANLMNGDPLPEDSFPLKLVGSDVTTHESVTAIASIIMHMEGSEASTESTPEATEAVSQNEAPAQAVEGDFVITGKVENPSGFAFEDLNAMEQATVTVEDPHSKTMVDYTGVSLNALLDLAGLKPDATKIVITSSDGFTAEVNLADFRSCPNVVLGITDDNGLVTIFPELPASNWAKFVVSIDVQ